jgi:glycosyltransferase involved in cell wall biosynthesis
LRERGIPSDKLVLIPNGVDIELFQNNGKGQIIRRELGIEKKFVVGYIGTHGMAHRLDTILDTALLLKNNKQIHFLFVGDGAEKARLVELAARLGLANVTFHVQVGRYEISSYYAACDVCLVPLRKADLFTKNIPSKIYEIMASAKPIIISTEGESRKLVESAGAGIGAAPEDAEDIAAKIKLLLSRPELCQKMGLSGFSYAVANCSRTRQADSYMDYLSSLVCSPAAKNYTKQIFDLSEKNNNRIEEPGNEVEALK